MMTMDNLPAVVSYEEWLTARRELLVQEKELTRLRDRVNADRRRLPMVRIDKPYRIELFHNGYPYLDLTVLGRQEVWEEPQGRATPLGLHVGGPNMRLPDEYDEE